MENTNLHQKTKDEFPEVRELTTEILDFSELSNIMGGNAPTQDSGCKGLLNGHCSGGTKDE